jgi:hypothetical protein
MKTGVEVISEGGGMCIGREMGEEHVPWLVFLHFDM